MDDVIPDIPVGNWAETIVDWLLNNWFPFFEFIRRTTERIYEVISTVLLSPSGIAVVLIAAAIAWFVRSWKFGLFTLLAVGLVAGMDLLPATLKTLTQVAMGAAVAVVVSIPIGILATRSKAVSNVVRPILDFMQTFPPFCYLIPAVAFFAIGVTAGMVATVVFSLPPGVRLTELGIRQVEKEMVEAGEAFGARPRQILGRIQLPLAMPSIMAGINQIIMLALSMVVLAGLVGAPGLGGIIYTAIGTSDVGQGVEAGLAIVVIAIFLDRITGAFSMPDSGARRHVAAVRGMVRGRNGRGGADETEPAPAALTATASTEK